MTESLQRLLFSLILNGLLCLIAARFLNRIIGEKKAGNKVFCSVCISGAVFTTLINRLNMTSYNVDLTAGAAVVFILLFFYAGRIWVKLMYGVLFTVLAGVSQIITVMLISVITERSLFELYETPFAFTALTVFSVALLWSLCEIIIKIRKNKENEIPAGTSALLITIPAASFAMLVIIFSWYLENGTQTQTSLIMSLSALAGILYINFIVFYILDQISGLMEERREKEFLKKQVDMQAKHYQQLEEYQNEVRSIRHDMKNNLLTLSQIMRDYGLPQTQDYLASLISTVSDIPHIIDTGNPGIDTVLNIKIEEARRQGIEIMTDIIIPQGLKLSFEKSAVLFGNLLDNAIEACVRFNEKTVTVKINMADSAMYLNISNPAQSIGLQTSKPDKRNHGIGLKNTALLIEDFNGMMKIDSKDGIFSIRIVLYGL